jgi:streptogramin lyase
MAIMRMFHRWTVPAVAAVALPAACSVADEPLTGEVPPEARIEPLATPSPEPPATSPPAPTPTPEPAELPFEPELAVHEVPVGSGPHDVAPAVDGGVWYTAQRSGELGSPRSGQRRDPAT